MASQSPIDDPHFASLRLPKVSPPPLPTLSPLSSIREIGSWPDESSRRDIPLLKGEMELPMYMESVRKQRTACHSITTPRRGVVE